MIWLGVGFAVWAVLVILVCAFVAGGQRKKTPEPTTDWDADWEHHFHGH